MITIFTPTYNRAHLLPRLYKSICKQDCMDFEWLVIDDGSTDNSGIIAKKYAEDYVNIEYVYEENQGLGHARNHGCEFVEGDYIIFLDSDDIVPPNAYELMYNSAIENKSDMVIGNVLQIIIGTLIFIKSHFQVPIA